MNVPTPVLTAEITSLSDVDFNQLISDQTPVLFKGLAASLPLVQAALHSRAQAKDYLANYYKGKPLLVFKGEPGINGRFAYNATLDGFNFTSQHMGLDQFFSHLDVHEADVAPPSFYCGSTDIETYFPGLLDSDALSLPDIIHSNGMLKSIWLGNRSTACAHFDISHNIAVCMAGHRRFTLFEPGQIANLYPGPLEPTPGGQVISLVDFANPDFATFPRFEDALNHAQVAEMSPGDVLFYPSMWWHQVEALDQFNILINYWWNTAETFIDTPMNTLLHALLSLRSRPDTEKQAWRTIFDYYIFGPASLATNHIPDHAQGPLGALDPIRARKLRALILNRFNR